MFKNINNVPRRKPIKLTVIDQNGSRMRLKLTMDTRLEKLKNLYSDQVKSPRGVLRFLCDGKRIADSDTPRQLEMEDGDVVEVHLEQMGGAKALN